MGKLSTIYSSVHLFSSVWEQLQLDIIPDSTDMGDSDLSEPQLFRSVLFADSFTTAS